MSISQADNLLRHLRQVALRQDGAGMSDGQLLRSFLNRRDEVAFEALVRRHGPMVRSVCRRVLHNADDTDDAFQAAFLVLVRKAASLASREVVGDWLHGVAYRTALKARAADSRRRVKESRTPQREAREEEVRPDWHALLDQEVGRLPEKYRVPVVLCDLEGRTRKEAARQLGWPEGTLSGRLSRARAMLARRLTQRGVTLSAGALAVALTGEATAGLPLALVGSTFKAATVFAAGQATGAVSAKVAALTEGVVKAMWMSKMKTVTVLLASVLTLAVGVGAWRHHGAAAGETEKPREEKSLPIPQDRVADAPKYGPAPRAPRSFQVDLNIARIEDGQRKELASPRIITIEGRQGSFRIGKEFQIPVGGGKLETVVLGQTVQFTIRPYKGDQVMFDMTVSQMTSGIFDAGDVTLETKSGRFIHSMRLDTELITSLPLGDKEKKELQVTATIREVGPLESQNSIEQAEKDLRMAEFYRRTGHPDSARFCYELIGKRYPDTIYAERAKERIIELKMKAKPAKAEEKRLARIGQIFIIGNKKVKQELIMKLVPLYPGQILIPSEIRAAERSLSQLPYFRRSPKITVVEPEDGEVYKDIKIDLEEK